MRILLLPALAAGSFLLLACSSNGGGGSAMGGSTTTATCPDNLAKAPNSEFCAKDPSNTNCALVSAADHTQVCGVALPSPMAELQRSSSVMEFAGSGPPDLGCYETANYPKAGTSAPVTMSGLAKIFAHGCASTNLEIHVYTVKRTGDAHDGELDAEVGKGATTPADCTSAATGVSVTNSDCGTRYECKYSIDMVPSETELAILTKGTGWAALYDYNIFIPTAELMGGTTFSHDVRALASDDYGAIAASALGGPITPGHAAVAGEVHDCGDVRLIGATVDVNIARKQQIFYFTDDEANPLPNSTANATTSLGLYAALDVAPGPVSVAALGLVNGKLATAGYYKVQTFADSVTAITFRGLRPYQIHP